MVSRAATADRPAAAGGEWRGQEKEHTFWPMADTRWPLQWHSAVTGPFCSFSYRTLNLFLVRGCPGSGTTSITSMIRIWKSKGMHGDGRWPTQGYLPPAQRPLPAHGT